MRQSWSGLACATLTLAFLPGIALGPAAGQASTFTNRAAFLTVTGPTVVEDFEGVAAGTPIASGASIGIITLTYALGGPQLAVTDGTSFGSAPNPASATSGSRFLGTDDADLLQDRDSVTLDFATSHGVGIYVLSRDPLEDGDVRLTAGGDTASLLASAVEQTLADGSRVWFLGVVKTSGGTFASASVNYAPDNTTEFLWNADDVTLALPEPIGVVGLAAGTLLLVGLTRRRRRPDWRRRARSRADV